MLKPNDNYTCTETLNWTAKFTQKLEEINQSSYTVIGPITARITGFVSIPFVSLAEALAHVFLASGKGLTGILVSPYNCLANTCFPDYSLPKELELSSALVHVILIVESIFTAALLPFVCLLNPSRADAWMNLRLDKTQDLHDEISDEIQPEPEAVNNEIEELNPQVQELTEKLVRAKLRGQNRVASRELQLKTANGTIEELKKEVQAINEKLGKAKFHGKQRLENKELELKDLEVELEQLKIDNQNKIEELNLQRKTALEKLEKEKEVEISNTINNIPNGFLDGVEYAVKNNPNDFFELKQQYNERVAALKFKHSEKIQAINALKQENINTLVKEMQAKEAEFKNFYENEIRSLKEKNEDLFLKEENLMQSSKEEIEKLKAEYEEATNNLKKSFETREMELEKHYKNEISLLKKELENITSSKESEANPLETDSESKVLSLKHALEITQVHMSHEGKIFNLESQFKAELAKFSELENAKTKEVEKLTIDLDTHQKQFAKEKRKLEKELKNKEHVIKGLYDDIGGMASTYNGLKNQIKNLSEEKESLLKQLCEVSKEKQLFAIAKEHYDIRDIVNATELRQKHKNIIMQSSRTFLQYITLPKVEKLIDKIQDIMGLVEKNPNIRLNFIMSGDDWEGDVEEKECENQFEGFPTDDPPNVDLTEPVIFDNSFANVFLTHSTFDLGESGIFTTSIIRGERSPDMDTLTGLREYFNKFKDAIEVSIQSKVNSPLTLNDKLILGRISRLQKV
ncbi:MAG: hypothetical protein H0T62_10605 [Parachlamydiaceae bacterium]|nr:hypothetical protein [Parachlamydiaceae bacterium]